MKRADLGDQPCSLARTAAIIGDRWTLLVLRDLFLGVRRFDDFQQRIGLSRALLSDRLRQLAESGIVARVAYQDKPVRHEYRLTRIGLDLYPVIMAMVDWGNRHLVDDRGPPLLHRHRPCGHDFRPQMHCSECGETLDPRDVEVRAGVGFSDAHDQVRIAAPKR
jgi:DNA-binding HxlR family transcriptional regulator